MLLDLSSPTSQNHVGSENLFYFFFRPTRIHVPLRPTCFCITSVEFFQHQEPDSFRFQSYNQGRSFLGGGGVTINFWMEKSKYSSYFLHSAFNFNPLQNFAVSPFG